MIKPHVVQLLELHPQDCPCVACEPYRPSAPRVRDDATTIGLLVLAGIPVGLGLTWAYDAIVGGPGVLIGFGL